LEAGLNLKKGILFLILFPACISVFSQTPVFNYTTAGSALSIIDYFGRESHLVVPASLNRRRVVSIEAGAFVGKGIVSITLPDSIREIGVSAFEANSLSTIVLGAGVEIEESAFEMSFVPFYNRNRRAGGIYVFFDSRWHYFGKFDGLVPQVQNGRITIVKYTGAATNVVIPEQINSLPVTAIGRSAFADCELHSVQFPATVYRIEDEAFRANNLTRLDLPGGIVTIGRRAFAENEIARVILPPQLTVIEDGVFFDNLLTSVEIPENVTSIGSNAFSVNLISRVTLPESRLKSIYDDAFSVNQIQAVTIPASVTLIGRRAFYNNRLTAVIIPDSVNVLGDEAFSFNVLTAVTLPAGLKKIGNGIFYQNNLSSITLPDGLVEIGSRAFSGNHIVFVRIPRSVDFIGEWAFAENEITSVIFSQTADSVAQSPGRTVMAAGVFADNRFFSIIIPDWIVEIGARAFYNNRLESLLIPASVTHIGAEAFGSNPRLNRIALMGSGNIAMDETAFDNNFVWQYEARRQPGSYVYAGNAWSREISP
jgi:hypothetical protein